MNKLTFIKEMNSLEEVQKFAQRLGLLAQAGDIIALDGDLGAGKTTFSQSYAKALGVTEIVNSPTFTIIKEYYGTSLPFYHMDVYRISVDEADELGLDEYFFGQGVTIVEWASIIAEIFPEHYLYITIKVQQDNSRVFTLTAFGERYVELLQKLAYEQEL